MNLALHVTAFAAAAKPPAHASAGLRWGAAASGLGLILLLYIAVSIKTSWNPMKLVEGADGVSSTSKFQWLVWIVAILYSYTAIWVLRAEQGNFSALSEIPVNLLTVLGFSTGTAAAAKGITSAYVQNGRVNKQKPPPGRAGKPSLGGAGLQGGIFQDDTDAPELAKIQMVGFTFIAIVIFLVTVGHEIVTNGVNAGLPNIDSSLMVLMGISTGGYLGKKLVTANPLTLYTPVPARAKKGDAVTLPGANLGSTADQLTMDGTAVAITNWGADKITFNVPEVNPATNVAWTGVTTVHLAASVMGQTSNSVLFTVTTS